MSDKFQLLLKQIRFPKEHDAFKEIKDGSKIGRASCRERV